MMTSLKELIVVLAIAAVVFRLAKPIALLFSSKEDFSRRRNAWFTLTAAAFVCPSFWLFALIAIPVLMSAGRKDSNPGALYLLLLQVIPAIPVDVPMPGLSRLFEIDIYILLSLFVMLPAALRLARSKTRVGIRGLAGMDALLISYGILTVFLFLHPESSRGMVWSLTFASALRRVFAFFVGIYLPYFVISRSVSRRGVIVEDMAALCLACAVMAGIAMFEGATHWLLYGETAIHWGFANIASVYYMRGAAVRAMASAGHPLALGYMLEIAFGFWLYLQSHAMSRRYRFGVAALLWMGLLATQSRGPWIAAACVFFITFALRPRAVPALLKAAAIAGLLAFCISLSPLGDRIASELPFLGGAVGTGTVLYRHELLDRAWQIIQLSPFLGDQDALLKMQDLRQGEGIIDVVDTYVDVALSSGFIGLSLFLGFILTGLLKSLALCRRVVSADRDLGMLGASLVACIVGTLIMMIDGSFGTILKQLFYVLGALAAAYVYVGRLEIPAGNRPVGVSAALNPKGP